MLNKLASLLNLIPSQRKKIRDEIDLFEAMQGHMVWRKHLRDCIEGRASETLQPQLVGKDDRCVLGQWIHGPGKERFGDQPLFRELAAEHARFHSVASKVVEAHQVKDDALAGRLLAGDFAEQSRKTVDCLAKLQASIGSEELPR